MATIVFGGALSHSPMMNYPVDSDHDQVARFKSAVADMAKRLRESKPDVLVVFGPDHFRALFYDLMPAFVIGVGKVEGWGDWNTPVGPFENSCSFAKHILTSVFHLGFEPAASYDIKVDHGIVQPIQLMELTDLPLVPIIINAAGAPLPALERCYAFGEAAGRAIAQFPGTLRVAVLGSGGLSHDPPLPSPESADPEVARRAIYGRASGYAASKERELNLLKSVRTLQARINPKWDRDVLREFSRGNAKGLSRDLTAESIGRDAGNGGQEIRTWFAVAGALGDPAMDVLCYEPIPALVTGMGVVVA